MNILEEKKNGIHLNIDTLLSETLSPARHQQLSEDEKIELIKEKFGDIMQILGLDLKDNSLKDTPARVAKMFVKEVFSGLDPDNAPAVTLFRNDFKYNEMLIERNIPVYSYCEHHFVPIIGKVHIGYISKGEVIGLSKLNRIVHYFAKRPQVQERLTVQIAEYLKKVMNIDDVAVVMDAEHLCVASRGVRDTGSSTVSTSCHGRFGEAETRKEFLSLISL